MSEKKLDTVQDDDSEIIIADWSSLNIAIEEHYEPKDKKPAKELLRLNISCKVRFKKNFIVTPSSVAELLEKTYSDRLMLVNGVLNQIRIEPLDLKPSSEAVMKLASEKTLEGCEAIILTHDIKLKKKAEEFNFKCFNSVEALKFLQKKTSELKN